MCTCRGRGRRGRTAATEFAVVLPVLATLVLGCVDFGRFAYTDVALTNAARAGAAYGAAHPYTPATQSRWQSFVSQAARDDLGDFNQGLVTVSATPTAVSGGWQAEVDVAYPCNTLVDWPGIPSSMTLWRKAVVPAIRP